MEFDEQLLRYFGSTDLGTVSADDLERGRARLRVDVASETSSQSRLAMWALLHIVGDEPDLQVLPTAEEQAAAQAFAEALARTG